MAPGSTVTVRSPWWTGRRASASAGKPLASRTRYYWTVRARDSNDAASGWARTAWFETALLDPTEWRGRWIAGPERAETATLRSRHGEVGCTHCRGKAAWTSKGPLATRAKNRDAVALLQHDFSVVRQGLAGRIVFRRRPGGSDDQRLGRRHAGECTAYAGDGCK